MSVQLLQAYKAVPLPFTLKMRHGPTDNEMRMTTPAPITPSITPELVTTEKNKDELNTIVFPTSSPRASFVFW